MGVTPPPHSPAQLAQSNQSQSVPRWGLVIVLRKHWDIDEFRGTYRPEWTDGEIHKEVEEYKDPEDIMSIPDRKDLIFFKEVNGLRAPILG